MKIQVRGDDGDDDDDEKGNHKRPTWNANTSTGGMVWLRFTICTWSDSYYERFMMQCSLRGENQVYLVWKNRGSTKG